MTAEVFLPICNTSTNTKGIQFHILGLSQEWTHILLFIEKVESKCVTSDFVLYSYRKRKKNPTNQPQHQVFPLYFHIYLKGLIKIGENETILFLRRRKKRQHTLNMEGNGLQR